MQRLRTYRIVMLALLCLGVAIATDGALPQTARTIKILISVPPGGTIDFLVRVLADHIGKENGQTILVESRPGAAGMIAAEAVARSAPDGNTLLVNHNGLVIASIMRKASIDFAGFEPICFLVHSPQVLLVNAASPYRTLAELIEAARAKPGALSIASVGPATTQHFAIERLKRLAGIDMTYVPFGGGAPAINALLGGHVTAVLQNYSEAGEQIAAGNLRALATPSARRIEPAPNVPTLAEFFPNFEAEVWFGLVAPAKTPKETLVQLMSWFSAALQAPEVKAKLETQALYPDAKCGPDFAAHIRRQTEEYARLIKESNIRTE